MAIPTSFSIAKLLIFIIMTPGFSSCSKEQKDTSINGLAGMYKLLIIESKDASGLWKESPWAKGGESYIIYDGLGHMAVQITPKGYKDFTWLTEAESVDDATVRQKIESLSMDELKAAVAKFSSNYVYTATYTVDDRTHVITHRRLTGSIPAMWGTDVKREYTLDGDTLTLKNTALNMRLVWVRQN